MELQLSDIERRLLDNIVIPPRPEALIRVSEEMNNPEPDVALIGEAIASDVSIAGGVLQIVNSAAFRRRRQVESIRQAVMVLGLHRTLAVVKQVAIRNAVSGAEDISDFWQLAGQIALRASRLAEILGKSELADNAYLLGLFYMVGLPVMAHNFADYGRIMASGRASGWQKVISEEQESYGTDHATIAALVAYRWNLPAAVVQTIHFQYEPESIVAHEQQMPEVIDLYCLLKLAIHAQSELENSTLLDTEWPVIGELLSQQLSGVSVDELEALADEVNRHLE